VLDISEIAWAEAPPAGWNPVEVLTKLAPASWQTMQARTISSSVSAAVSRMTFRSTPSVAARTARTSFSVIRHRPALIAPTSTTMSTSPAPSVTARAASAALMSAWCLPLGKPTTVHVATSGDSSPWASGRKDGEMQTEKTPRSFASAHRAATSAGVASGLSSVWSTMRASSERVSAMSAFWSRWLTDRLPGPLSPSRLSLPSP